MRVSAIFYILAALSVNVCAHSAIPDTEDSPKPCIAGEPNEHVPLVARCCSIKRPQSVLREVKSADGAATKTGTEAETKTASESDGKSKNAGGGRAKMPGSPGTALGILAAFLL